MSKRKAEELSLDPSYRYTVSFSKKFNDITLIYDNVAIECSKYVLYSNCKFFEALFDTKCETVNIEPQFYPYEAQKRKIEVVELINFLFCLHKSLNIIPGTFKVVNSNITVNELQPCLDEIKILEKAIGGEYDPFAIMFFSQYFDCVRMRHLFYKSETNDTNNLQLSLWKHLLCFDETDETRTSQTMNDAIWHLVHFWIFYNQDKSLKKYYEKLSSDTRALIMERLYKVTKLLARNEEKLQSELWIPLKMIIPNESDIFPHFTSFLKADLEFGTSIIVYDDKNNSKECEVFSIKLDTKELKVNNVILPEKDPFWISVKKKWHKK